MARKPLFVMLFFLTLLSTTQAFSQQSHTPSKTPDGTWLDMSGNTRKWTMRFPLRRFTQANYSILEFACYEGEKDLEHYTPDTGKK
jgi:hypothetical protein